MSGDSVTVDAGASDDTVLSSGERGSINGGNGNNYLSPYATGYNIVIAGAGDDIINIGDEELEGTQYHNRISVSGGSNLINNSAELSTIETGDGNDTILTGGGEMQEHDWIAWYASITASNGSDLIILGGKQNFVNAGAFATLTGGTGNDLFICAAST